MIINSKIVEVRENIKSLKSSGYRIGLVPTMGYFHEGHLALMRQARTLADKVVVSLFVNPTQFGSNEDLDHYPQDFDGDCAKARSAGVDLLFCPENIHIYHPDHQTCVTVSNLSERMCGTNRPHHFSGVATVVSKLFNIVEPDVVVFGEKDFQQLAIIRKLAGDLNFPVEIIGHETVREMDGLAMSSRNAYLSEQERKAAVVLFNALDMVKKRVESSDTILDSIPLLKGAQEIIVKDELCSIDYLTIVDETTLEEKAKVDGACRIVGAIKINNRIRLIDNLVLR